MPKKTMLLAVMALAIAALAIPAPASAEMFLHGGEPIAEEGEATNYSGTFDFTMKNGLGGIHCAEITVGVTTTTASAHVTQATGSECETFGLWKSFFDCHVKDKDGKATTLPWTGQATTSDVRVMGAHFDFALKPGCVIPTFGEVAEVTMIGDMTATPVGGGKELGQLELSGEAETTLGGATLGGILIAETGNTFELE